ncbi:MAG: D-glycero-alpha-D-manno-heptose-1,7-bisphosphate 7-phosphatase [Alphaproteobacteria bacterium]
MAKALFLDRDGVVNADDGYTHRVANLRFVPGIFDLCLAAGAHGFRLVIATNQSGIGRGLFTEADYRVFTGEMLRRLQAEGIAIAAVYHCPYHPSEGIGPYRRDHPWRKPKPGMLLDAARALSLDLAVSALVGDGARDIEAARAAGIGTAIRVAPLEAADRGAGAPDAVLDNVAAAASWFAARFPPAR